MKIVFLILIQRLQKMFPVGLEKELLAATTVLNMTTGIRKMVFIIAAGDGVI